jgi:hypothetical protein
VFSKLTKAFLLAFAVILGTTVSSFSQDTAGEPGTFKKDESSTTKKGGTTNKSGTTNKNDGDILGGKKENKTVPQNNSGILFPEVEGWKRSEKVIYPVVGLGYSYNYDSSNGGRVTIYVYDKRLSTIPDGVNNSAVKDEFKETKDGLKSIMKSNGVELKETRSETITLGGSNGKVKSLYALYEMSVEGRKMVTEVYIFGYKNNFIKIRATRPKDAEKSVDLNNLLAEFDSMFAN